MLTKLGKFIFLVIVLGNLSLNHILLGYCHHVESVFITHCPCEDQCPCGECPCEESGEDCSTYLALELDEFSQTPETKTQLVLEEFPPSESITDSLERREISQLFLPLNQATGPPGSTVPFRHLYASYLI